MIKFLYISKNICIYIYIYCFFHWFLIDFYWFSILYFDLYWLSIILKYFWLIFINFHFFLLISMDLHWFFNGVYMVCGHWPTPQTHIPHHRGGGYSDPHPPPHVLNPQPNLQIYIILCLHRLIHVCTDIVTFFYCVQFMFSFLNIMSNIVFLAQVHFKYLRTLYIS